MRRGASSLTAPNHLIAETDWLAAAASVLIAETDWLAAAASVLIAETDWLAAAASVLIAETDWLAAAVVEAALVVAVAVADCSDICSSRSQRVDG
jgi:hypothetical protein